MPRIPSSIADSIVYLYRDIDEAETGVDIGGSGFLLGMPSEACSYTGHIYVVTNKHVVEGVDGARIIRLNLAQPESEYDRTRCLNFTSADWILDPLHDIGLCPLPADLCTTNLKLSVIDTGFLVTREELRDKDLGPGDQVVYVGRFAGHAGRDENMPSVRFGNISMNPNEREPVEYELNGSNRKQVGFLVEARSRSGYSGSPVFCLDQHVVNNRRAVIPAFDMRLLGVDWGHIPEKVQLQDPRGIFHGNRWYVEVHAGMMGVVPAWYVLDLLQTPGLVEQRRRDDVYYKANPPL